MTYDPLTYPADVPLTYSADPRRRTADVPLTPARTPHIYYVYSACGLWAAARLIKKRRQIISAAFRFFPGRVRCGDAEPHKRNLHKNIGTPS